MLIYHKIPQITRSSLLLTSAVFGAGLAFLEGRGGEGGGQRNYLREQGVAYFCKQNTRYKAGGTELFFTK